MADRSQDGTGSAKHAPGTDPELEKTVEAVAAAIDIAKASVFQSQEKFDQAVAVLKQNAYIAVPLLEMDFHEARGGIERWTDMDIVSKIETDASLKLLRSVVWEIEDGAERREFSAEGRSRTQLQALRGADSVCRARPCDADDYLLQVVGGHPDDGMRSAAAVLFMTYALRQDEAREKLLGVLPEDKHQLVPERVVPPSQFTQDLFGEEQAQ